MNLIVWRLESLATLASGRTKVLAILIELVVLQLPLWFSGPDRTSEET
jgi:hypothetical protein